MAKSPSYKWNKGATQGGQASYANDAMDTANSNTFNKTGARPQHQAQPLVKMPSMGGSGGDARVDAATRGLNPAHADDIINARRGKQ